MQKNSSRVSFTDDGWTSVAGKTYYGITAHLINENWKYQSFVLDFIPSRGRHTGKDIAAVFSNSIQKYEITEKVQGITVDMRQLTQSLCKNLI